MPSHPYRRARLSIRASAALGFRRRVGWIAALLLPWMGDGSLAKYVVSSVFQTLLACSRNIRSSVNTIKLRILVAVGV